MTKCRVRGCCCSLLTPKLFPNDYSTAYYYFEYITVGPVPDMILPTADCLKLVVAIEAEPYFDNIPEKIEDPLGAVTIIKFKDVSTGNYTMKVLNFSQFDDKYVDFLALSRLLQVYRPVFP